MRQDLLFETSRFNLSRVGPHFVNPCCFGEDVAEADFRHVRLEAAT